MVFALDTYSAFVRVDITPSVSCVQANIKTEQTYTYPYHRRNVMKVQLF